MDNPFLLILVCLTILFISYVAYMIWSVPSEDDKQNVLRAIRTTYPNATLNTISEIMNKPPTKRKLSRGTVDFILRELERDKFVCSYIKEDDEHIYWALYIST